MKLTKCESGHFYDADKYPECPYCNPELQHHAGIVRPGGGTPAAAKTAEPYGPVTGWLVVMDGPARGRDLRLGEGRNFLGLDGQGCPAVLDSASSLAARQGIVVFDPADGSWCALPGSSHELCALNGRSLLEKMPLAAGDTFTLGGAAVRFVPFCTPDRLWQDQPAPERK